MKFVCEKIENETRLYMEVYRFKGFGQFAMELSPSELIIHRLPDNTAGGARLGSVLFSDKRRDGTGHFRSVSRRDETIY